jgi:hypothetical protein
MENEKIVTREKSNYQAEPHDISPEEREDGIDDDGREQEEMEKGKDPISHLNLKVHYLLMNIYAFLIG